MTEAVDAEGGGLGPARLLQVSDGLQAARVRLGDSRGDELGGQMRVELHVIHADLRLTGDLGAHVVGGRDGSGQAVEIGCPVDRVAGREDARPCDAALRDVFPQAHALLRRGGRVANRRDAEGEQKLQRLFARRAVENALRTPLEVPLPFQVGNVGVHIHEAGDEELAARVDDLRARRRLDLSRAADGGDAALSDDHGGVGTRRRSGAVDHGDAGHDDRRGREKSSHAEML